MSAEQGELPWIPELAGDYDLVRELGRGGTAVVYLARDRELGRDVAIKLIRPAYVQDEDAVARLVREARTVGKLQHPGIVMLLGTRRLGERGLALILQYVPGETLKSRIRSEGPLPFPEVERVLQDLGKALEYAHAHRIVHRDLKPENVYMDEASGMARLADFGLARGWDSDSGLTMPGTAIGTPTYMAPEQLEGRDVDGRSDLYSLGMVGYEAVTGKQPWAGESLYSLIHKQKHEDLPSMRELRPDVPDNLVSAIEGAIRKDPRDRWQNAQAFLGALSASTPSLPSGRAGEGMAADATAVPAPSSSGPPVRGSTARLAETVTRKPRRSRKALVLGAALGVVLVAALALRAAAPDSFSSLLATVSSWAGTLVSPDRTLVEDGGLAGPAEPPGTSPPGPSDPTTPGPGTLPPGDPGFPGGPTDPQDPVAEGGDPTETPAGVSSLSGQDQSAPAGSLLPIPVGIRVVGSDQVVGVPEVPVLVEIVTGSGSVTPDQGVTGPDGSFYTRWELGAEPGEQELRLLVEGDENLETVFRATSLAPVAQRLEVSGGSGQEAAPGSELPSPLTLRVVSDAGLPVPGIAVSFEVATGGGSLSSTQAQTGASGDVTTQWTLGASQGEQEVVARVEGLEPVTFRATARAPALSVATGVVVGGSHSCTVRANGTIACWGANGSGQIGDGSTQGRTQPTVLSDGSFVHAASGLAHVCALNQAGTAHCWGSNDSGQLGSDVGPRSTSPVPVEGTSYLQALTAGAQHTCGLAADTGIFCWGGNQSGQLGNGSSSGSSSPVRVSSNVEFRSVAAGWRHTCALSMDGIAFCWGNNANGQLGSGGTGGSSIPVPVSGGHRFQSLDAGNTYTCGVTTEGVVLCWGGNESGQLGDGTFESRTTPQPIQSDERFQALAAGGVHACALTQQGDVRCWGRNIYGQLGDGTTTDRATPVAVVGDHTFAQLSAFGSHNCGQTNGGGIYCWGYNLDGQLGDGSRTNRSSPVPVAGADS